MAENLTPNLLNYLNGIFSFPFLKLFMIYFKGYLDDNLKMISQQYIAWSDCTDVQAVLALYWWQRLITFGSNMIIVKHKTVMYWQREWTNRLHLRICKWTSDQLKLHAGWSDLIPVLLYIRSDRGSNSRLHTGLLIEGMWNTSFFCILLLFFSTLIFQRARFFLQNNFWNTNHFKHDVFP